MELLQQFVNGLTQGSIYALIALGYTLVYGVLRFINFAHGDVYMVGSYAGLFAYGALNGFLTRLLIGVGQKGVLVGAPAFLLVVLTFVTAMIVCAAVGIVIERLAYRPLRQAPRLTVLITAIGVSLLLEYGGQVAFTPNPQGFPGAELPPLIPTSSAFTVAGVTVPLQSVVIVVLAVLLMLGLQGIVAYTKLGRAMRAVSLDREAASLMGVNTDTIITFTFALGSALAAAAGVLDATYQGQIDPLIGLQVGLKAFVAAVLGGIGSIPGAVVGGLLLGFAETAVKSQPALSQYSDAISFAVLIAVLIVRPAGLLGRNVAEKV